MASASKADAKPGAEGPKRGVTDDPLVWIDCEVRLRGRKSESIVVDNMRRT